MVRIATPRELVVDGASGSQMTPPDTSAAPTTNFISRKESASAQGRAKFFYHILFQPEFR
jgi:hypothetical protein